MKSISKKTAIYIAFPVIAFVRCSYIPKWNYCQIILLKDNIYEDLSVAAKNKCGGNSELNKMHQLC